MNHQGFNFVGRKSGRGSRRFSYSPVQIQAGSRAHEEFKHQQAIDEYLEWREIHRDILEQKAAECREIKRMNRVIAIKNMYAMECKSIVCRTHWRKNYEAKSGYWIIEGLASTSHRDLQGDVILPGAFASSMERIRDGQVKLCLNHDYNLENIIGVVKEATETAEGLHIRAAVDSLHPLFKDVKRGFENGTLDAFSIGFNPVKYHEDEDENGEPTRFIEDLELLEISLVNFPSNSKAKIISFKNSDLRERAGEIESIFG